VTRDLDLFAAMAADHTVRVAVSITTLDQELARKMEPRTSIPAARLRAIEKLSAAGVPTFVMIAPVIPGLNDSEIPAILAAARDAGAEGAAYTMLRLPYAVRDIFFDWLDRSVPNQAEKVRARVHSVRDGKDNDSRFGHRMRGSGIFAEQSRQTFRVFAKKFELDKKLRPLDTSKFQPPQPTTGQQRLF